MRRALVYFQGSRAGELIEHSRAEYEFKYDPGYDGHPISRTMPLRDAPYKFTFFPAFFDGLLPEGVQLEALLKQKKIDRSDHFSQLLAVGEDLVGAVTVKEAGREDE